MIWWKFNQDNVLLQNYKIKLYVLHKYMNIFYITLTQNVLKIESRKYLKYYFTTLMIPLFATPFLFIIFVVAKLHIFLLKMF